MVQTALSRALVFAVWAGLSAPAEASRLASSEVALAQGLLAFQEGDDEDAVERFAAAARLDPDAGSPRYWRGLALLRLGRAREAAAEIEASLEARRPPEADRERVLSDLAAARRTAEGERVEIEPPRWREGSGAVDDRGRWEGSVGWLAAVDTNPNLFSEELSLPPPDGGELIRGEEPDGVARLGARLAFHLFHRRERPSLGLTLEARQSFHRDFGFLDLGRMRGLVQLASGSDPLGYLQGPLGYIRVPFGASRFTALIQAGGTVYQLDGASYLRAWEGAVSLTYHESAGTASRLEAGISDRDFAERTLTDERRSGEDVWLQASQLFFFGRRDRYLRLGALAMDRRAGAAFTASLLEANAELVWPAGRRWTVALEAGLREDDYGDRRSNLLFPSGEPRDDTTARGALTVAWSATARLRWTARSTYIRRSSTVDLGRGLPDLEFRRLYVSAGMGWVF